MRGFFYKCLFACVWLADATAAASSAFVAGADEAFDAVGAPPEMRAAYLATAERETGMRVHYRSDSRLRDERAGGSYTAYQILKPNLLRLLEAEGLRWSEVVPAAAPTAADIRRYARIQTRLAMRLAREGGPVWNTHAPECSALDLFAFWAAGSWTWSRVRRVPAVRQVLGDGALPSDNTALLGLGRALDARKLRIASSAVHKLAAYRRWRVVRVDRARRPGVQNVQAYGVAY